MWPRVRVVVPQRGVARWTLRDGLAQAGFRGQADELGLWFRLCTKIGGGCCGGRARKGGEDACGHRLRGGLMARDDGGVRRVGVSARWTRRWR